MKTSTKTISSAVFLWMLGLSASAQEYSGVENFTIQRVFVIITGLACWFTRFALILMVVMIVFYGIKFMMSQGNQTKFDEAKKSFTWALVGVLVILGTYTIIATIANGLGADISNFMPLDCSQ
ncbi:MAG: hypothetical protein WD989_00585 [Candidatus Paceibacterota bacterium]